MEATRRGGKKNRKWGREKRRPSHARYTLEKRWLFNKARKIAKYIKKQSPSWNPGNIPVEVRRILRDDFEVVIK